MDKKRILVVDDEDALTMLWRLLLERTGRFIVREESRGASALETAREFHPDLILLDHHLPDKDGTEIAAELRNDAELESVPIVFLTGGLTQEEAQHALFGGFPALAKPIEGRKLIRFVSELLSEKPGIAA